MYSIKRWLCVSVACAALVACGGGGGGDGDDDAGMPTQATGRFESSTYVATTDDAIRAVSGSLGSESDLLVPQVGAASSDMASAAAPQPSLLTVTRNAARRTLDRRDIVRPQATDRYSEVCDSGRIDYISNYASATTVTPGDSIEVIFQSCVLAGETFTGSALFTVRSYRADSTSVSSTIDIAFRQFGSATLRLNGAASFTWLDASTSETTRVSFLGLTATTPQGSRSWYHTVESILSSSGNERVSLSGFVQVGGQFYRLTQLTPFDIDTSGRPYSGRLSLTDAQGARVEIQATATRFVYSYYAPGATTPTLGPVDGLTYAQLGW